MTDINYLGSYLKGVGRALFGFSSGSGRQIGVNGNGTFIPVGLANNVLTLLDYKDFDSAFFQCSTLQTVVINKGQCKVNATWDIYKGDKVSTNPRANDIRAKMKRPNCLQTYPQFRMEVSNLVQIHGFCLLWFVPNGASVGTGFQNIWALNPADLVIEYKLSGKYVFQNDLKDIIESIKYNYAGGQIDVPLSEISIVRDQVATKSTNGMFPPIVPTSRIYGLKMVISNNLAAYDSRNSLIVNKGPTGFLSNGSKDAAGFVPMQETDKIDFQQQWEKYGILHGQYKMAPIANADMKYIPVGSPTKDLLLMEETEETMCRIVDVYGYQVQLLATSKTSSIGSQNETQKEARKNLYQNTIIPEDANEMPAIFQRFGLENDGLTVKTDYSHIEELKQNEVEVENLKTARLANIGTINALPVDYETKINIACEVLKISNDEASKLISNKEVKENEPQPGQAEAA